VTDNSVSVARNEDTISIAGRLDFSTAKSALLAVNAELQSTPSVSVIDLGGVTHSNSAGLALMIEWLAEAQRSQRDVRFQNIPDSLRQISTVCQVDSLI